MRLPMVNLPDYFTALLRSNLQSTGVGLENLKDFIASDQSFAALVEKTFRLVDEKGKIENIIKSLGWHGFRDSLASVFIEHRLTGSFSHQPKRDLVKDVVIFEDYIKPYTVTGYSRGFLLGFYLKMAEIDLGKDRAPSISYELIDLLKLAKARTIKVDWLLLTLWHGEQFLGLEKVEELLKQKLKYEEFYNHFDESQKEIFIGNLLTYGSSINDSEIFYSRTV